MNITTFTCSVCSVEQAYMDGLTCKACKQRQRPYCSVCDKRVAVRSGLRCRPCFEQQEHNAPAPATPGWSRRAKLDGAGLPPLSSPAPLCPKCPPYDKRRVDPKFGTCYKHHQQTSEGQNTIRREIYPPWLQEVLGL